MYTPAYLYKKSRWTFYAVTSKRAITFEGQGRYTVMSFAGSALRDVKSTISRDGVGELLFRIDYSFDSEDTKIDNDLYVRSLALGEDHKYQASTALSNAFSITGSTTI